MKRIFGLFLALVLAIMILPMNVSAATTVAEGTCGDGLTWVLDDQGTLTVSGSGAMTDYSSSQRAPWYEYRAQIVNLIINYGTSHIGNMAFSNCENLLSIQMSSILTMTIGDQAFSNCESLSTVSLPDCVTSIGRYAFSSCTDLREVVLSAELTTIPMSAFSGCSSLTSVTIPKNVTSIASCAFSGCSRLESVSFFVDAQLTNIDSRAFESCSSLTSFWIPASVTSIGEGAFQYCREMTAFTCEGSIAGIEDYTFRECSALQTLTLPNTITKIGEYAFYNCDSLEAFSIPSKVTTIAASAFENCSKLSSIQLPEGLTAIGDRAFYSCSKLTGLAIPTGVTSIGKNAVFYCDKLTSIAIPANVSQIGEGAFSNNTSLTSITVASANANYKAVDDVLYTRDGIMLISYPAGKSDTSYTVPSEVTTIGNYAFGCAYDLSKITFMGEAPAIGDNAFYGLTAEAQYDAGDATWTAENMKDYGGNITWVSAEGIQVPALSLGCNELTLPANTEKEVTFTPAEDGDYWIAIAEDDFSATTVTLTEGEGQEAGYSYYYHPYDGKVYELKAGETYTFKLLASGACTRTIQVTKVNRSSKIEILSSPTVDYVGDENNMWVEFDVGSVDCVTVVSGNENVVKITKTENNRVWYMPVGAGKATLTLTSRDGHTTTFPITVYDTVDKGTLTLETPVTLEGGGDQTVLYFTPTESGLYWLTLPAGVAFDVAVEYDKWMTGGILETFRFENREYTGLVVKVSGAVEYTVKFRQIFQDNVQLKVIKTQLATGITLDADTLNSVDPSETVGFTLYPANAVTSGITVTSDNESVASGEWKGKPYISVNQYAPGTANLTVTTNEGASATLSINVTILIGRQPADQTVDEGDTAAFTVEAIGKNLTYQWQYKDYAEGNWTNAQDSGSQTATLTVPGTTDRNGYQYRCILTDANGNTVYTDAAALTVKTAITITLQPQSRTIKGGESTVLATAATGDNLSYQWEYWTGSKWVNAYSTGHNTASMTVTGDKGRNGLKYRCKITSGTVTIYTNTVKLTVNTAISITTQPVGATIKDGATTTFSVKASGTNLSYQWEYWNGSKWVNAYSSGHKTAAITITGNQNRNNLRYRCKITNGSYTVYSGEAKLKVNTAISITTQPSGKTIKDGATTTFSVKASGTNLSYQWEYWTGSKWADCYSTGHNTATMTVTGNKNRNNLRYRCKITNGSYTVYSDEAKLKVNTAISITTQPVGATIKDGATTTFTVKASGTNLSYQWEYWNGSKWVNAYSSGHNTAAITITGNKNRNNLRYRCKITNGDFTVYSGEAKLKVNTAISITTQPVSQTVREGNSIKFSVVASGTNLSYQWQYWTGSKWADCYSTGHNTATMTVTGTAARNGLNWRCKVSNGTYTAYTATVKLTVHTIIRITQQPTSKTVIQGSITQFSVKATGTGLKYQWQYWNGEKWVNCYSSGHNTSIMTVNGTKERNGLKYRCLITDAYGYFAHTNQVILTVKPPYATTS